MNRADLFGLQGRGPFHVERAKLRNASTGIPVVIGIEGNCQQVAVDERYRRHGWSLTCFIQSTTLPYRFSWMLCEAIEGGTGLRSGHDSTFKDKPRTRNECSRAYYVFSFRQECFALQLLWANQELDGSRVPRNRAHKGGRGTEPKMHTEYCSYRKCSP